MELRREVLSNVALLVTINLLVAFGAVGLLGRMSPAISRILDENVTSIQAGQELMLVLAQTGGRPASREQRERFVTALREARDHALLAEEVIVLDALQRDVTAALDGDPAARNAVLSRAAQLTRINLGGMRTADGRARRLGAAGAWTAVFLAALTCVLGVYVMRRLRARIIRPIEDLQAVVEAATHGDRFRRCRPYTGPNDIARALQAVNELLDERLTRSAVRMSVAPEPRP